MELDKIFGYTLVQALSLDRVSKFKIIYYYILKLFFYNAYMHTYVLKYSNGYIILIASYNEYEEKNHRFYDLEKSFILKLYESYYFNNFICAKNICYFLKEYDENTSELIELKHCHKYALIQLKHFLSKILKTETKTNDLLKSCFIITPLNFTQIG